MNQFLIVFRKMSRFYPSGLQKEESPIVWVQQQRKPLIYSPFSNLKKLFGVSGIKLPRIDWGFVVIASARKAMVYSQTVRLAVYLQASCNYLFWERVHRGLKRVRNFSNHFFERLGFLSRGLTCVRLKLPGHVNDACNWISDEIVNAWYKKIAGRGSRSHEALG